MNYDSLGIGKKFPKILTAVVEIPKGGHNKYEVEPETGFIKLDRVLHSPLFYPVDYGFIPQTLAPDGDHLDVLIVTDSPAMTGCVVEVRPLGILRMTDGGEQDDKIIAVQANNPHYHHKKKLSDLAPHLLDEITHFFEEYKKLENKQVDVTGYESLKAAEQFIIETHKAYKNK
ncbi:MAG: Inorganic pyrophosphatase [Parcubacteria group bacterium GW2011_GWE2_38_18]|nr:MAG: Inorganic pyrophosphatase [Parcubacteria group bacterium GW2011_GWE2_38_18]